MALKDWKIENWGMESPGWYNIIYRRKTPAKNGVQEIVLSNSSKEHEGTDHKDSEWTFGISDYEGQPLNILKNGESQIQYKNQALALKYAKAYMRKH